MRKNNFTYAFALIVSWIIAIILAVTAYSKIFYPSALLTSLDFIVGVFELFLAVILIFFHRYASVWAVTGSVFAAWAGYSFYFLLKGLPCGCMGKLLPLPEGFSFGLDLIFFILSLICFYLFSQSKKNLFNLFLSGVALGVVGYFFAILITRVALK